MLKIHRILKIILSLFSHHIHTRGYCLEEAVYRHDILDTCRYQILIVYIDDAMLWIWCKCSSNMIRKWGIQSCQYLLELTNL